MHKDAHRIFLWCCRIFYT